MYRIHLEIETKLCFETGYVADDGDLLNQYNPRVLVFDTFEKALAHLNGLQFVDEVCQGCSITYEER